MQVAICDGTIAAAASAPRIAPSRSAMTGDVGTVTVVHIDSAGESRGGVLF